MLHLIHDNQRGYGISSSIAYKKGDKILEFTGEILPLFLIDKKNNKTYLPIDYHFGIKWGLVGNQCYINHSCNPNCFIDLVKGMPVLTAVRDIPAHEELCYNYNTFYLDISRDWGQFPCHCYSENCIGIIQGFLYLNEEQELEILDMCSPFIKKVKELMRNSY